MNANVDYSGDIRYHWATSSTQPLIAAADIHPYVRDGETVQFMPELMEAANPCTPLGSVNGGSTP